MEEQIPNWILDDRRENKDEVEECWKNTETQTQIYVMRNEGEFAQENRDGDWIVTGENSSLYVEEEFEQAKEKAVQWMLNTPKPSPMV